MVLYIYLCDFIATEVFLFSSLLRSNWLFHGVFYTSFCFVFLWRNKTKLQTQPILLLVCCL